MVRVATTWLTAIMTMAVITSGMVGVTTAAVAPSTTTQQQVDRPVMTVEVHIEQTPDQPGHARLTYTISVPDNVREVRIALPKAYADERQQVTTSDFKQTREGDNPQYTAFSAGGTTRSLTIEASLPTKQPSSDDPAFGFDTGSWAYFSNLDRYISWTYESGTTSPRLVYDITYDQAGFNTESSAFVGKHTEYTHRAAGQRYHLIVPEGVTLLSSQATIFNTLAATAQRLPVGEKDDDVYVVALRLSEGASEGGFIGQAGDNVMWVSARRPATGPNNVYVHEYVHTRQTFTDAAPSLQWFVEGSARYLEYAVPLARGNGSVTAAESDIPAGSSASLTNPDAWPSFSYQYDRGARVLALLNKRIIEATDGRKSVRVVFRGLNERAADTSRRLTGGDLQAVIRQTTPVDTQAWYQAYVEGTEYAGIDSPWAFVIVPNGDPDGDGVQNTREYQLNSHPFRSDTDDDGLNDGAELDADTDPTTADTDGDGLTDQTETQRGLDPTKTDTDGDGTPDGAENTPTSTASPTPTVTTTTAGDATPTPTTATTGTATTTGSGPLYAWIPLVALVTFGLLVGRYATRG